MPVKCTSVSVRRSAAIAAAAPGDLSLGPIMSTRMACPEPASSIEDRFLAQLGGVTGYGFLLGEFALRYEIDGRPGVMLFRATPAKLEGS